MARLIKERLWKAENYQRISTRTATTCSPSPFLQSTWSSTPNSMLFFFFNATATTEIYTLSLHDALPIAARAGPSSASGASPRWTTRPLETGSEGHTAELQGQVNLGCRVRLGKKKRL